MIGGCIVGAYYEFFVVRRLIEQQEKHFARIRSQLENKTK